jgi:hypothetical protein
MAKSIAMQKTGKDSFSTQLKQVNDGTWYLEMTDALGRRNTPEEKRISIHRG